MFCIYNFIYSDAFKGFPNIIAQLFNKKQEGEKVKRKGGAQIPHLQKTIKAHLNVLLLEMVSRQVV